MHGPGDIETVRRDLKSRRRQLSEPIMAAHAPAFSHRIWSLNWMQRCRHIAGYAATNGEVSCAAIMHAGWARGREFYLPVLIGSELRFARYGPDMILKPNRFNILEPDFSNRELVEAKQLDVVITPLVGCDYAGTRLGMGGGYYDRAFRFLANRREWRKPKLVGLAHDFQIVESLPRRRWDIPLDAVITPSRTLIF